MPQNDTNNIVRRTIGNSIYNIFGSVITLSLGLIRTIFLFKLLLPDDFGVATQALFFVGLAALIRLPSLDSAIIHRKEINSNTLPSYFTLRMITLSGSLLLMAILTPLISRFYPDMALLGPVILAFLAIDIVAALSSVQETIISRNLHFRRITGANIISSILTTSITLGLAWYGWGVWSLVAERFIGQFTRLIIFWTSSYSWSPRLGWDKTEIRWLKDFGLKGMANTNLNYLLDRFDDFYVGTFLGKSPLGYYSRAYELARYPRRIAANPLLAVFFPTFARLQSDRQRLSKAFVRSSALIIRLGLWTSFTLALIAPELVEFLGAEWQPMLKTLQLMVIYTMLDPVALVISNLLLAIGYPEKLARTRFVQLVFFIPVVILLGRSYGIEGVAVAANLMVLLGLVILYIEARHYVDYSVTKLWKRPLLAIIIVSIIVILLSPYLPNTHVWVTIILKSSLIFGLYFALLFLLEKKETINTLLLVKNATQPYIREFKEKR